MGSFIAIAFLVGSEGWLRCQLDTNRNNETWKGASKNMMGLYLKVVEASNGSKYI